MLLSKILPEVARIHPANYAMKCRHETITYDELLYRVSSVARALHDISIKPGDRIALLGYPTPYLAIAECAAIAIGAIPVAIFPGLASTEIKQILQDAAPIAVVYDLDLHHVNINEIISSLDIEYPISCESGFAPNSIEDFINKYPPLTQWYEAAPDDVALIIYTGGTTGRSKGVMHSHRNIRNWAAMNLERGGGHNPAQKLLVFNQAHLTGQFTLWTTLFEGSCLVYLDSYPPQAEEVVEIIEREQLKFLGTVGLLFRDIVNLKNIKTRQLQSIEGISCGGAPISEKTFHKALDIFPNVRLTEVYSQTESGNFISHLSINQCFNEGKLNRLLSVGNPENMALWGQEPFKVRIIDESGIDVEQGNIGEIICQGDQMMLGYWNNPEETSKSLQNGWLYTGDLGKFDQDGFLYLLDRKKDMIIVGASNVYCSEVEEALSKHPTILEVAVIGTPLDDEGEEVTAVVTLKSDSELTLEALKKFCLHHIASFKILTRLEIIYSIPRTSVGKLNKAEIRKKFWAGRTRMIN
jgi:long-chain acyl-CoA synthetase